MSTRARPISLPMRVRSDTWDNPFQTLTAGLDPCERFRLIEQTIKATELQGFGRTRALIIVENTDTGDLSVASTWPWPPV